MSDPGTFALALRIALPALGGALTWTFLEYVIHRWLGHDKRYRKTPFGHEHVRHHSQGDYFAPTWKKVVAALTVGIVVGTPSVALFGLVTGVSFTAGLLAFYGVYEALHRLEHVSAGIGPYGRWARRHHFTHHFVDARTNHGVTSPLWDVVFGTYRAPGTIRVPSRLCMSWLRDERGEVREDFRDTFVLGEP